MIGRLAAYGYGILIGAIIINIFASLFGLSTWFDYAEKIQSEGFAAASSSVGVLSLLFMYVVYPALLGGIVLLIDYVLSSFS